jgi:NADH dehydrogenase
MIPIQVRPTAYMETWAGIVGGPILASGKARIFGRGRNPINFVSSADVAVVVDAELARVLADPADASPRTLEVVGPEDLSFNAIVECFAAVLGRPVPAAHVPLPMLRALALGLRPFKPVLADQIAAAVVLDTTDRRAGTAETSAERTLVRGVTTFDDVVRKMVAAAEGLPARA